MSSKIIDILIDTSILREDALLDRTDNGNWLRALGIDRKVRIHLCKIIEKEIKTQLKDRVENSLKVLRDAYLIFHSNKSIAAERRFLVEMNTNAKKYESDFNKSVEDLYNQSFIVKQETLKDHVDEVFNDYFTGGGNFKTLKSRLDIPDGFIYQYLRHFNDPIICVTKDKQLSESCKKLKHVTVYESLDESFKCESLIKAKEQYLSQNIQKEKRELLLNFIQAYPLFHENTPFNVEEHLQSVLQDHTFECDYLASLENEALLENIYKFELDENQMVAVTYAPENSVAVRFEGKLNADISYFAYNDNLHNTDDFRISLYEMVDQNISHVYEEVYLECSFILLINLSQNDLDSYAKSKVEDLKKDNDKWKRYDSEFLESIFNTDDVQLSEFKVISVKHIIDEG